VEFIMRMSMRTITSFRTLPAGEEPTYPGFEELLGIILLAHISRSAAIERFNRGFGLKNFFLQPLGIVYRYEKWANYSLTTGTT
jgi:hypothetical protein